MSCDVLEWETGTWLLLAHGFSLLCIVMSGALELCVVHWSFPTERRVLHLLFSEWVILGLGFFRKSRRIVLLWFCWWNLVNPVVDTGGFAALSFLNSLKSTRSCLILLKSLIFCSSISLMPSLEVSSVSRQDVCGIQGSKSQSSLSAGAFLFPCPYQHQFTGKPSTNHLSVVVKWG